MKRLDVNVIFAVVFVSQLLVSVWDVIDDWEHHLVIVHLLMNLIFAGLALIGLTALFWQIKYKDKEIRQLSGDLALVTQTLAQKEASAAKLMGDLAVIIHRQFDQWLLSDAEKEIALLLLKGLSLEEIAVIRGRSEKTVRQQASHIYNKAGLEGRHSLSAYFFEDLLQFDKLK